MPNRMIRDEILESERVLSLPDSVRWFFLSVLLTADDLGLFEATEFKLARRATIAPDQAGRYLQMLVDADLVRLYDAADGKRYGFVPRFRQRIQIKRPRFPLPLLALMHDDLDAVKKINDLARDPTDGYPMGNGDTSDAQPSEAKAKAKGITVPSTSSRSQALGADGAPQRKPGIPECPHQRILALWAEVLPALPQHNPDLWDGSRATALRQRWRDTAAAKGWSTQDEGLAYFRRLFVYVGKSVFLTGKRPAREPGGQPFQATLEFVVTASKWRKLLEGAYHTDEATT